VLPAATTGALATVLYITANLTAGGGIGVLLGGSLDKGLSRSNIQKELKQKYNLDVNTQYISIYQMEDLPQEAVELCELYNKYGRQEQMYTEVSQAMMAAAMLEFLAAYALEVYGTNLETMLRNWVGENNEGAGNGLVKEGLGKISGKTYQVTQSNINAITQHLSGDLYAEENVAMINRLQNALNSGQSITGADASFYLHELKEIELMQGGMVQTAAHQAALDFYQVSKFSTYHPDVIKAYSGWFNDAWFDFWGITR